MNNRKVMISEACSTEEAHTGDAMKNADFQDHFHCADN